MTLESERLVLRPVAAGDHARLHALFTQPGVRRVIFDNEIIPPERTAEIIRISEESFRTRQFGLWLAWGSGLANPQCADGESGSGLANANAAGRTSGSGLANPRSGSQASGSGLASMANQPGLADTAIVADTAIGFGALWHFRDPPELELLYGVGDAYVKRGYGREIARAIVGYGFGALQMPEIRASTDPAHTDSRRLLDDLEFVCERQAVVGGLDTVFYSKRRT